MRRLWDRYSERIDAMTLRERVFIFAAVTVGVVALLHTLLLDAELKNERRLSRSIAQRQAEMKALEQQVAQLAKDPAQDADRARRERLAEVKRLLDETERNIVAEERKFTAPEQMKRIVDEMLARSRGVQLMGMRTLATTSIADARAPTGAKPAVKPATPGERLIYRHGMEVTVSGGYLELLRYLEELERLPTQLYWSALELDASRYPAHTLKVVVYTLSLDPAWLNV